MRIGESLVQVDFVFGEGTFTDFRTEYFEGLPALNVSPKGQARAKIAAYETGAIVHEADTTHGGKMPLPLISWRMWEKTLLDEREAGKG